MPLDSPSQVSFFYLQMEVHGLFSLTRLRLSPWDTPPLIARNPSPLN